MLIFRESPNYSFITSEISGNSQCDNIMKLLPQYIQRIINKVKDDLIKYNNLDSLSNLQIAACIYFVCSVTINNGGVLQKRLLITDLTTNKQIKITTEFLGNKCGKFAAATLSNNVNKIVTFYNSHENLKSQLL
jgi:hypothetical protein